MRSHPTDPVSLAFGLIFLGIAGLWLATRFIDLTVVSVGWFVAGGLLVLGGIGIAHAVAALRRQRSGDQH